MLRLVFVRAEPRIVGRYAVYGEIASGGMATVHIARRVEPGSAPRTVAIKRTHPHLARDPDFALMFLDEARVASRIRHPNVVETIDVLDGPDELALVMEYVRGESVWKLARLARERGERLPVRIAASIVVGALHGLHAAHEATDERGEPLKIVHRDVSPQNILVGTDGVARLVDFGIAKAVGRLHSTRDSSVKGKYAYMAPEQVRGDAVSRLTDVYAAAIVFWELLTGERLFAGKTEAETIHKCLVGRVQPPSHFCPDLPPELDEILRKALSREQARRYQTAKQLAGDIEAVVPAVDASEVGAWVEHLAGESLAARAGEIEEIAEGESGDAATAVMVGPASQTSPRGVAVTAAPRAPARGPRSLMMSGLVVAALVAAGALTLGARRRPAEAASAPAVTSLAPTTESAAAPTTPEPATSIAVAAASAPTPTPPSTASASAPASRPAPHAGPRPPRPKRAACNPPYSIDSQGRQIFKPECM